MTARWRRKYDEEIVYVLDRFENDGVRYVTWRYGRDVVTATEANFIRWHRKIRLVYE